MNLPEISLPQPPNGVRFELPTVANGRFEVTNLAEGGRIQIFDLIGQEVRANTVSDALKQIGPRPVVVEINSPGGSYFEGVAIYNLLRAHPAPVTARVMGIAASAASIIAMGASRVEMARNAEMMIHGGALLVAGGTAQMEAAAAFLRQIDAALAETYARRTGLPVAKVAAMLAAETYLPAAQAIALGFADALLNRDADPRLRPAPQGQPQSKRDMEGQLRAAGFSRTAAARVADGGWAALAGNAEPDLGPLTAALDNASTSLKRLKG